MPSLSQLNKGTVSGLVYVDLTQLDSSERREPQMRKCLHEIWLQDIFLISD